MKKLFSFLSILFLTISLFAQELQQKVPIDNSVKIGTLPNGLTYYIKNNPYPKNNVEMRLVINAGSILETDSQQGLAHFMEHMNFNGTKKFPKNELVSFLQSLGIEFGADLNAYTSFNETVYMLPIPTDKEGNFDKGMDVMEDWAFNATLDGNEIDKERGVIMEEKLARSGANSRMMYNWLPKVYAGSKYANRLPIGTEEILLNFKHDEIRKFHSDWYRPNLMAIIIVGDIDINTVEKSIIDRFSKYENPVNAPKRENFDVKPHDNMLIVIENDPEAMFTQVNISYVDKEKSKKHETIGDFRDMLIDDLFTEIINNRFDEIANGNNPPFTYAYSGYGGSLSRDRNEFSAGLMASPETLNQALKVLLTENERVQQHGFVQSELDRAKKSLMAKIEKTYNNRNQLESGKIINQYVDHFLEGELIPSVEWEFEQYNNLISGIKLEEVSGLIKKYIHNEPAIVITSKDKIITENEVKTIFDEVNNSKLEPYSDKSEGLVLLKKIPNKGKIKKVKKDEENGLVTYILGNGAKVIYKKTSLKEDEILFKAYSYGGTSLISDSDYLNTRFAMNGLKDAGINNLSLNDLNTVLTGKTASVTPSISTYEEVMQGNSSIKDLETMFQLINSYFTGLNNDKEAYASYVKKSRGIYDNIFNNPEYHYYNEWIKFLNQNDPRNGNIMPKAEDWETTDYDKAYNIYKQRFANPSDFTFIFVGSINENKLKEYVEIYLASLKGDKKNKETYKTRNIEQIAAGQTKIFKKGSEDKVMVTMQYQTPTVYSELDELYFKMLNAVLEIKLTENLRESEGGVYSLRTNANINRIPQSIANLSISIPTSVDKYEKMIELAKAEVQNMLTNEISDEYLDKVKETMINDYKEDIQKNKYWLQLLHQSDFFKFNPNKNKDTENTIRKVKTSDILAVAKKYLATQPNIGILLPEKDIVKQTVEKVESSTNIQPLDIVNKYLMSITGEKSTESAIKKLDNIKKITSVGKIDMMGMSIAFESIEEVKQLALKMDMMGQKMTQVMGANGSYMESGGQKQNLPEQAGEKYANRTSIFEQTQYATKTLKFKETIKVGDALLNVIEVKDGENTVTEYYDNSTGLLVKIESEEGSQEFLDYKSFDGYLFPTSLIQIGGGQTIKTKFDSYKIN